MQVEWKPKNDFSTVCEPFYQMASFLVDNVKVTEDDDAVHLNSDFGCDSFVPRGKKITSSEGKSYDGLFPTVNNGVMDYVLSLPALAKKARLTVFNINRTTKGNTKNEDDLSVTEDDDGLVVDIGEKNYSSKRSLMVCGDGNCVVNTEMPYCFVFLAKYLKYLRTYHPEEERKQRDLYEKNPFPAYEKLPKPPFDVFAKDLEEAYLTSDMMEATRFLIDRFLVFPTFRVVPEDHAVACQIIYPVCLMDVFQYGLTSLEELKEIKEKNPRLDEPKRVFGFTVPNDYTKRNKRLVEFFYGSEQPYRTLVVPYYVLIVYTLLAFGQYEELLAEVKEREKTNRETVKRLFGGSPLLNQMNRFYAVMTATDNDDLGPVAISLADCLRQRKKGYLSPVIREERLLVFAENFGWDMSDGGYDNFNMKYFLPHENEVYLLTDITEFIKVYKKKKKEESVINRAKTCWYMIDFFRKMQNYFYIILVGSPTEIDKFLALDPSFPLLFSKNRFAIPDYSDEAVCDKVLEYVDYVDEENKVTREEILSFLDKHRADIPLENDRLVRYMSNSILSEEKLPNDFPMRVTENFMDELDKMVGISMIKEQVRRVSNLMLFYRKAKEKNISLPATNLHMLFKGNPGTGKTTVARIVAGMMYHCGVCKKKKFVEVHVPDLIGEYLGQTSSKTRKVIEKALDGVLFLDEAYALTQAQGTGGNDYGRESLAVIVKMMEDYRDRIVFIFAGYSEEMEQFVNSNPGLRSRIGYVFDFADYSEEELLSIFLDKLHSSRFEIDDDAVEKVKGIIRNEIGKENFGNGRFIDKVLQEIVVEHAQRVVDRDDGEFCRITVEDIPSPALFSRYVAEQQKRRIGFSAP